VIVLPKLVWITYNNKYGFRQLDGFFSKWIINDSNRSKSSETEEEAVNITPAFTDTKYRGSSRDVAKD